MAARLAWVFIGMWLGQACTSQLSLTNISKETSLTIDASIVSDSTALGIIAPYKIKLDEEMSTVVGRAPHRLEKQLTESSLGNLVADIIFETGASHYSGPIHFSVVSLNEINSPLAQGPIRKSDIYELMPTEHKLYILELNGSQLKELITRQARKEDLSFGNAALVIKDKDPFKFYVDGAPADWQPTFTLAVSDFLANGGEGMDFLKGAKRLQKVEVTIRDLIFDYMTSQKKAGKTIEAKVEGRIKILP